MLPLHLRELLLGSPAKPSRLANAVHALLNALPGERFPILPCTGVLNGFRMKIDWRYHRSFVYGTWEPQVVHAVCSAVGEGQTAIDIGSHIGFYALVLAKLVGPAGRIYAFEPLPENFGVLEENIRLNQCNQVTAIRKAVGEYGGQIELRLGSDGLLPGGTSSIRGLAQGRLVLADAISVDDFWPRIGGPVHFMKIDVEGAEEGVLRGAAKTLRTHRPLMLVELHEFNIHGENHPALSVLRELGYGFQWVNRWTLTAHVLARPSSDGAREPA